MRPAATGTADGSLAARFYGSDEHYHQTFPAFESPKFAIPPALSLREPHRYSQIPELGAAALGASLRRRIAFVAGADVCTSASGIASSSRKLRRADQSVGSPARHWPLRRGALGARGDRGWPVRVDWFRTVTKRSDLNCMGARTDPPPTLQQTISIRAWGSRASWGSIGPSRLRASGRFARPRPASSTAPRKWATSSPGPTHRS
jgi:hypothetical protein